MHIVGAVGKIFPGKLTAGQEMMGRARLEVSGRGQGEGFQAKGMTFPLLSPYCHHPGPATILSHPHLTAVTSSSVSLQPSDPSPHNHQNEPLKCRQREEGRRKERRPEPEHMELIDHGEEMRR